MYESTCYCVETCAPFEIATAQSEFGFRFSPFPYLPFPFSVSPLSGSNPLSRALAGSRNTTTRHRASTSMYSLTFCVRVMSSERHHWKTAVQAAAVMLRTPPSTASHRPASHAHLRYTARNVENASVTRRSLISNARTPYVK